MVKGLKMNTMKKKVMFSYSKTDRVEEVNGLLMYVRKDLAIN